MEEHVKSVSQIFSWIADKTTKKPDVSLYVSNEKSKRAVEITDAFSRIYDGSMVFSLDSLWDDDKLPQTFQELCESVVVSVRFRKSKQSSYDVPLSQDRMHRPRQRNTDARFSFSPDDIIWSLDGMCIHILHDKSRSVFMLSSELYSASAQIQRSLRESARVQMAAEEAKAVAVSQRKDKRNRARRKLHQATQQKAAAQKARQEKWDLCVQRMCAVADASVKTQQVIHIGTVLKLAPLDLDFGEIYSDPEFRKIELRRVDGAFQFLPDPPVQKAPAPLPSSFSASVPSSESLPITAMHDSLLLTQAHHQIRLLQQEVMRLSTLNELLVGLPPPYPM